MWPGGPPNRNLAVARGRRTGEDLSVDGRIEEISATVAAVTRAAGTALDPSTVLHRTLAALEPAVAVASATLWLGEGDDLRLVASYPAGIGSVTAESLVIPLGPAAPGRVRRLPSGKLEITVEAARPLDEWLTELPRLIAAAQGK